MINIIKLSEVAYQKFLSFVIQHANPYKGRNTWQEVIGFLFGRFSDESETEVYITDVLPMDSGSAVYVKIGDYSPVFPVISKKMEKNEFIVGWIHSHPGLGIFLSGTDVTTQQIYQSIDPRSIAIVVDQTKISKTFPGMKCFRIDNKGSYGEIPLEIENIKDYKEFSKKIYDAVIPEFKVVPPVFSNQATAEYSAIKLKLKTAENWNFESGRSIPIFFYYDSRNEGFLKIFYQVEVFGGQLQFDNMAYKNHLVYDSGILAYFLVKPQNSDLVTIKLDHLELTNNERENNKLDPIELVIRNQKKPFP